MSNQALGAYNARVAVGAPSVAYTGSPPSALVCANPSTGPYANDKKNWFVLWPGAADSGRSVPDAAFDPTAAITVKTNPGGNWTTMNYGTDYTVNRLIGQITFKSALGAGVLCQVTACSYMPVHWLALCQSTDWTLSRKNIDQTVLNEKTIVRYPGPQLDSKGTLTNFFSLDEQYTPRVTQDYGGYATEQIEQNRWFIVYMFMTYTTNYPTVAMWAKLDQQQLKIAMDQLITEQVQYSMTNDVDGNGIAWTPGS